MVAKNEKGDPRGDVDDCERSDDEHVNLTQTCGRCNTVKGQLREILHGHSEAADSETRDYLKDTLVGEKFTEKIDKAAPSQQPFRFS